jgi:hypothetical protein
VNGHADGSSKSCKKRSTATAEFFPLTGRKAHHRKQAKMHLRSVVGVVELEVWHGKDPQNQHWGCPIRERWGLRAHQQMSPALEERLAFTATLARTYQGAAELATQWGCAVDDSGIHELVQRLGSKAEAQTQARLKAWPPEKESPRAASALAVLMVDGWQVRFRGPGWGKKKTKKKRVAWHELKTGVFYLHEQAARTAGGRGMIIDKTVVRWQGEPLELGRRLHWEALRGGLGRARQSLVLGDGIAWIWNLKAARWPGAIELLDFWHGGEHVWELGRALHGGDERQSQAWVEPRLHQLRHGEEQVVLKEIASLKRRRGPVGETIRKQQNYFAGQAGRMNYKEIADRGWPIGSGPVESACRSSQCRYKGPGQFWTPMGLRHLCALEEARQNGHWDQFWLAA